MTKPELILKWGTVKGWGGAMEGTPFRDALEEYKNISGMSMSAMMQDNTQAHKDALCKAIDAVGDAEGEIWNDWEGTIMSREDAKEYVQGYGKK